jgi:hypothetical protein
MIVAAAQGNFPKERLHAAGAHPAAGLQSAQGCVVGKKCPVVVERADKSLPVAPQRRPQALFDPLRLRSGARTAQARFDFAEEGFRFAVTFPAGFFAEFFLAAGASCANSALRRISLVRAMVCSTNASASCAKRS